MDVDDPSAAQSIFHPWTLPWFKPEWAHRAGLYPEPHLEVAEISLDFPAGTLWQRDSHGAAVSWEAQRAPRALAWLSPPT